MRYRIPKLYRSDIQLHQPYAVILLATKIIEKPDLQSRGTKWAPVLMSGAFLGVPLVCKTGNDTWRWRPGLTWPVLHLNCPLRRTVPGYPHCL